jgi:hypothetical protein
MQMKEAHVVIHPIVPNLQVCMMSWKVTWWYGTISGERTTNPFQDQENQWGGMQRSIGMVDNTWRTFFLC